MILSLAAAVPYTGLLFALLGLMSTALPFGLYTMGLKHMEAGRASILASVEPLTSTVVGIAIFHEALSPDRGGRHGLYPGGGHPPGQVRIR